LLVWTHGGPSDQWQVEFRPKIAYFVEREWSVLVPDHRGSSGHGRAWLDLLEGQWGVADVEDTVAAMEAAVARGWGVPEQMVPIGASAGGFTSLGVAAARPDLCRAVVAMYPVVDLVSMATTTHRWERAYDPWLIGSGADGKVNAAMRSPLAHAASLERPLLLLHGTADPVVPFAHSDLLADAILRAGRTDVVLIRYPGAGHGFSDPEHAADSLRRIDAFLATHVTDHR
jgi:dipeptidyl aminopeptidase/acylaminoacyl peptidase